MTKAIICNGPDCQAVLTDGDLHIVTAKWHRSEQAGIDGKLHPSSKAKRESHYCSLECAATWADDELARIAEWETEEAVRREQLRAEEASCIRRDDAPDDLGFPEPQTDYRNTLELAGAPPRPLGQEMPMQGDRLAEIRERANHPHVLSIVSASTLQGDMRHLLAIAEAARAYRDAHVAEMTDPESTYATASTLDCRDALFAALDGAK